jgi:WD40 repeat protein
LGALSPDFRIVATTQFIAQGKGDLRHAGGREANANPPGYGIVRLRDTQTGQVQRKLIVPDLSEEDPVFEYGYTSLRFSPDGKTLACMANTERGLQVSLWEVQTGRLRRKLVVPENPGMEADVFLAFSPDSQMLATVGDSDIPGTDDVRLVIRVWDLRTGTLKRKLWRGVEGLQVAFSPDGKRLAVANNAPEDHSVRLWDIASGRVVRTLSGHQLEAKSLAFSPEGKLLATASEDHSVRVWDLATGRTRRTLAGAYDLVFFLPDGRGLVTAGGPHGEARLWNLKTGQQERSLSFQECTRVNAVSRDGKKVADLDSGDGTLQIERLW